MLGKLFKHEVNASRRTLLPMLLALPVLSGLVGLIIRVLQTVDLGNATATVGVFMGFLIMSAVISMIAISVGIPFALFYRYYKSCFTDEGYLTFTLPVRAGQILSAKTLTSYLWMLFTGVVVAFSGWVFVMVSFVGIPGVDFQQFYQEFINILRQIVNMLFDKTSGVAMILSMFVSPLLQILLVFLAITLGSVIAKKRKILASVGMYMCVTIVANSVKSLILLFAAEGFSRSLETSMPNEIAIIGGADVETMMFLNRNTALDSLVTFLLASIVIDLLLCAGAYFWNRYLLKNKLNLD